MPAILQAFSVCAFNQVAGELPGPVEARFVGVVPGLGQAWSIRKSLFDPAVSDPRSHIMRMDGANYSCQVPQNPARPNGGTSPFGITDTIWGGIRPLGVSGPDMPPPLVSPCPKSNPFAAPSASTKTSHSSRAVSIRRPASALLRNESPRRDHSPARSRASPAS